MPEGDTIHKLANFLAPQLYGQILVNISLANAPAARRCEGQRVSATVARGKHLFIELDNGLAIRSHLGMHGSWHRYPHGGAWQRPRSQLSLILSTTGWEYVCFNAREVEVVRIPSVRNRIVHAPIGPDLIADNVVTFTGPVTAESYIIHRIVGPDESSATIRWQDRRASTEQGDWYYVRVTQYNGQYAWSSPIWVG